MNRFRLAAAEFTGFYGFVRVVGFLVRFAGAAGKPFGYNMMSYWCASNKIWTSALAREGFFNRKDPNLSSESCF